MSQIDLNLGTSSYSSTPTRRDNRMSFIEVKKAVKSFPILRKENITVKEWSNTLSCFFSSKNEHPRISIKLSC